MKIEVYCGNRSQTIDVEELGFDDFTWSMADPFFKELRVHDWIRQEGWIPKTGWRPAPRILEPEEVAKGFRDLKIHIRTDL